jgi:hypothetical protein
MLTFTYYKEKAPLLYQELSEHLQRFAQYVTLPKTNSHVKFATTRSRCNLSPLFSEGVHISRVLVNSHKIKV